MRQFGSVIDTSSIPTGGQERRAWKMSKVRDLYGNGPGPLFVDLSRARGRIAAMSWSGSL